MKNLLKDEFTRKAVKMTLILTAKTFGYMLAGIASVMVVMAGFIAFSTPGTFFEVAFIPVVLVIVFATIVYFTREAMAHIR